MDQVNRLFVKMGISKNGNEGHKRKKVSNFVVNITQQYNYFFKDISSSDISKKEEDSNEEFEILSVEPELICDNKNEREGTVSIVLEQMDESKTSSEDMTSSEFCMNLFCDAVQRAQEVMCEIYNLSENDVSTAVEIYLEKTKVVIDVKGDKVIPVGDLDGSMATVALLLFLNEHVQLKGISAPAYNNISYYYG